MNSLRPLLLLITSFASTTTFAAPTRPKAPPGEPVEIARKLTMESKVMGEKRPYFVHLPPGYEHGEERYPLVILLDGEGNIAHTSTTVDFLAGNARIPRVLLIGVGNTNRDRDLTPPTAKLTEENPDGGGAPKFLSFIADELIPEIERTYRTRPYRILIGHSYGGLFATYTLFNRPEVFNAYLSISPSLWYDEQRLVTDAPAFLENHKDLKADLFMTMGNEGGYMLGGASKLTAILGEKAPPALRFVFHPWPEETHGSIPLRSTYDGLQWIFDGYYVHDAAALYDNGGIEALQKRYARLSARLGYEIPMPELVIANTGRGLVRQQRAAEAIAVMKRTIELFPKSTSAHIDLGQAYAELGDLPRAIEEVSTALRMFPGNRYARSLLEKVKVDPTTVVPRVTLSAKEKAALVGEYSGAVGKTRVFIEDGTLFGESAAGRCELEARAKLEVYCLDADVEVTFRTDKNGRVIGTTVHEPERTFEEKKIK
jgi:predicted alpha/beta superfamily hydrolase